MNRTLQQNDKIDEVLPLLTLANIEELRAALAAPQTGDAQAKALLTTTMCPSHPWDQ